MGSIAAFLQPPVMNETKEVIISERFKENGKVVPFIIRVIDQETNNKLIRQSTKKTKIKGQLVKELDDDRYSKLLVQTCVVEPNFKLEELCSHYKTTDPLEVPGRMLKAGEFAKLVKAIKELNEFDTDMDEEKEEQYEEEAKN